MGDQPDSWARRKRHIIYSSSVPPFIFTLAICAFIIILPISRALGIEGSVSYIWEQGKENNENKNKFTQIYDLILSRRLQPLYDAGLKFEFRSETKGNGEQDREKTQLLPSLNMRLGNDMTGLNMGWSEDITADTETFTGEDRDYTHEKAYAGLNWRPKWLPHILWQFQRNKRKETWGNEPRDEESDDRFNFIEDYTLRFGPLTLDHNFDHEIRQIDGNETTKTTNYELLNKGNIRHEFSFFDDRLYMGTGYELIQDREKKDEDKGTIDTWKNNVNFNVTAYPADWITPEYKAFWGDIETDFPDKIENDPNDPNVSDIRQTYQDISETTLEHDLTFLFMPHPYFSSTLGMYYNRLDKRYESSPEVVRELETISIKLDPQLQGLIFDPNISMYPIMTSILMSSSTERNKEGASRILSLLFTGATTIYQGVDFDLDLSLVQRKNPDNIKSLEHQVNSYLKLDLLPNLKGSINQKAKWRTDRGGSASDERHDFEGDVDTRLIYRPVNTFMLDIAYMVDYDDRNYDDNWQFNINWRPSFKMELDLRYQTGSEEREEYFLGELDLYMTDTIHLDLRYQHPSKDQKMKVEFNMRF